MGSRVDIYYRKFTADDRLRNVRAMGSVGGLPELLASGLAIALFSIVNLSMSLPEDEQGPGVSRATLVRRRLHSRYTHLELRLHSLVSLRRELQDSATEQQKQTAASAAAGAAAAMLRLRNHTSNGSAVKGHNAEAHAATAPAVTSAAAAAAAAATSFSSSAAARRAHRGARRPAPVAASPPPSMGPPLLLRPGREAACVAHDAPLEALARATCSLSEARQQFVWEARS